MRRPPPERGSAAVEFVWFTLLLLIPLVYALIAVFEVQRAAYAVSAASAAATRAFVQAESPSAAHDVARRAAAMAMSDHDRSAEGVEVSCTPSCHEPGSTVTVTVRSTQRLPLMPSVFGETLGVATVDSTHSEPYGTYRAGAR